MNQEALKKNYPIIFFVMVLTLTILPYHNLIGRGYTDPDDFKEVYRALVEDIHHPSDIFLTPHEGDRYRPLNRLLTALTVWWGHGAPEFFVARNTILNIVCVLLVFLILQNFTKNYLISSISSLLFGLHPGNVNIISVDVVTHAFGTSLVLLVILIITLIELGYHSTKNKILLSLCVFLLFMATFSGEIFAWVFPVFLFYLLWKYHSGHKEKTYLLYGSASIILLFSYVVVRQIIITDKVLLAASSPDTRYGIQSITQIIKNMGMFVVGVGNVWDYIYWINPIHETIPTSLHEIAIAGIWFPLVLSLLLFISTGITSLMLFVDALRRKEKKWVLPLVFYILSLISVSVVSVGTTASETYIYLANALMAIAQALILYWLLYEKMNKRHQIYRASIVLVVLFILVLRGFSTEHRNLLLMNKAHRIDMMQSELRQTTRGFYGSTIIFSKTCPEQSLGYSIYGADGLDIFAGSERSFVDLTLNNFDLDVKMIPSRELSKIGALSPLQNVVWVDAQGHMAGNANSVNLICP